MLRWLTDAANLPDILLTTAPALIQRVPPPETWAGARVELKAGDPLDPGRLTAELQRLGYILDDRVDEPGEVAVRGGRTVDVFPAAAPRPCRIEHDGGKVTAIRSYDPVSQRSLDEVGTLVVDPATEIVLAPDAPVRLKPFSGQEHQLPTLYGRLATVLDYVPEARLVVEAGAEARADAFFEQIAEGRGAATSARGKAAPLYLAPEEWREAREAREVAVATKEEGEAIAVPVFLRERRPGSAFSAYLRERLKAGEGWCWRRRGGAQAAVAPGGPGGGAQREAGRRLGAGGGRQARRDRGAARPPRRGIPGAGTRRDGDRGSRRPWRRLGEARHRAARDPAHGRGRSPGRRRGAWTATTACACSRGWSASRPATAAPPRPCACALPAMPS